MARKPKRTGDPNQVAHLIGQIATGEAKEEEEQPDTRNPAAVALGKLGASKGGKARAKALSPRKRKEIARKAAAKRWSSK